MGQNATKPLDDDYFQTQLAELMSDEYDYKTELEALDQMQDELRMDLECRQIGLISTLYIDSIDKVETPKEKLEFEEYKVSVMKVLMQIEERRKRLQTTETVKSIAIE